MKYSALFRLHQRLGAQFCDRQGWNMPATFTSAEFEERQVREHCGLADLSYRAKFESQIQPAELGWRLAERHYLMIGDAPLDAPRGAIDVTSVYANLFLAGPQSQAVLEKLTSLNISDARFPNLSCAQASLAHVHAIALHDDIGSIPGFHLLVTREYAESVWEAVFHAGHQFHLQAFGLAALEWLRH